MGDFFVRLGDLNQYTSAFSTLTQDSVTAMTQIMDGLMEYAGAWGDDAAGQAFFAGYGEPASETLVCTAQMPVQLDALSAAMSRTVDSYLSTEATNTGLGSGATNA